MTAFKAITALVSQNGTCTLILSIHFKMFVFSARSFMPIRGGSDVFSTEDWKPTGTSLFTPVKQDIYVNVSKYDQISAAQGSFYTADVDGNYQNSVVGTFFTNY